MFRWILLAAVVVAITAGVTIGVQYLPDNAASPVPAARAAETKGPTPALLVEGEDTFDFGMMPEQTEQTKIWPIKNSGQGPLQLTLLETSCTCTNVRFGAEGVKLKSNDDVTIPPGETKELYFTWNSRDRKGEFASTVRFATNDFEKSPTLTLGVKGIVKPSVVLMPTSLEFGEASNEIPTRRSVLIFSPTKDDLKIVETPTASRGEFIGAEVHPLSAEQRKQLEVLNYGEIQNGFEVTVELRPGMPIGRFRDVLVIRTDHPNMSRVDVPLSGRLVGPIAAVPASVFLPGVSSKKGGKQVVKLSVRGQELTKFEVQLSEEIKDVVQVQIEPESALAAAEGVPTSVPVRSYRMTVSIPSGARSGQLLGTIVLQTDHPQASEIKIPLQAFVRAG